MSFFRPKLIDTLNEEIDKLLGEMPKATRKKEKNMATAGASGAVGGSEESADCGHCTLKVAEEGVQCRFCHLWYHYDEHCSGVDKKYREAFEIRNLSYECNKCCAVNDDQDTDHISDLTGKNVEAHLRHLQKMVQELATKIQHVATMDTLIQGLYDQVNLLSNKIDDSNVKPAGNEYAEKLKANLKTKNTLVIKSTDVENKAASNKKVIMNKIKTEVDHVKETNEGHLIVNFADKDKLENAKREFEAANDESISVKVKEKLWPKIKLCNVPKDDEVSQENIIWKNQWIEEFITDEEDFKVIKTLETTKDTVHYIIKCKPEIRKQICIRGNVLYTLFARNRVVDSYKVYQCFQCQGFNHDARSCNNTQVCAKCGGNHRLNDCTSNTEKCVNCEHKGHVNINHRTNGIMCPIYNEELSRIKNKTDHGLC